MRIGVFDSGIGGLTVLKTLMTKFPHNEYIYYGDTLNVPYGNKTKEELLKLADDDISFLISHKVDMIVIACGTISSTIYNILKDKYSIPIYDIISPSINYLNKSNYKNIGIIATHNTINSHIFKNNLDKFVIEIETPELVPLIEKHDYQLLHNKIDKYLYKVKDRIDCLLLGCTHYPIIYSEIAKYLDNSIPILDMSNYILLPVLEDKDTSFKLTIYFSKLDDYTINNIKTILDKSDLHIELFNPKS